MTDNENARAEEPRRKDPLVRRAFDAAGRPVLLRRFGWAFLLAWVFCVFYTESVDGYIGGGWSDGVVLGTGVQLFFNGLPVFASVAMLVLIVFGEKRWGSPVDRPALFWLAPAATAVSTPLLFASTGDFASTAALFAAGAVLTGFGSGFLWVMWGEFYAKITQEDAEFLAPVSAVAAAVLVLVVSSMSGWVSVAVVAAFPLLSGVCLAFSWRDVQGHSATAEHAGASEQRAFGAAHDRAKESPLGALRAMGRGGLGVLVACLFVCVAGTFWPAPDKHALPFQSVLLVSMVIMAVVALVSVRAPRRISMSFLYRWMCPALVIGFASLIVLGPERGGYVAYMVAISARFAFCLITQLYFARFAASGKATAVQSFGLGWIFVHLGDFLGVLAFVLLDAGVAAGLFDVGQVAAASVAVLVVVTMYVLNDEKSFALDAAGRSGEDVGGARAEGAAAQEAAGQTASEDDDLAARIRALAQEAGLTPRETEVFDLLARGRSVPYIRDALVISRETAATHAKHVYAKLDVHSRQELIDLVH